MGHPFPTILEKTCVWSSQRTDEAKPVHQDWVTILITRVECCGPAFTMFDHLVLCQAALIEGLLCVYFGPPNVYDLECFEDINHFEMLPFQESKQHGIPIPHHHHLIS